MTYRARCAGRRVEVARKRDRKTRKFVDAVVRTVGEMWAKTFPLEEFFILPLPPLQFRAAPLGMTLSVKEFPPTVEIDQIS